MGRPMTLLELRDAIAKAIADEVGHGMREKCERQADAVLKVVAPQLLATADDATLRQQAGRVDETEVERVAKALFDGEQASRNGGWQWSECSSIEVEGWKDLARSAIAALAQNTQGDGEAVAGVRIRRVNGVADIEFAMTRRGELLPDGLHQFYLHAERARVPADMVLVPREPTPAMLAAVEGSTCSVRVAEDDSIEYPLSEDECAEIYRNMLAAATAQPKDAGEVMESGVISGANRTTSGGIGQP